MLIPPTLACINHLACLTDRAPLGRRQTNCTKPAATCQTVNLAKWAQTLELPTCEGRVKTNRGSDI